MGWENPKYKRDWARGNYHGRRRKSPERNASFAYRKGYEAAGNGAGRGTKSPAWTPEQVEEARREIARGWRDGKSGKAYAPGPNPAAYKYGYERCAGPLPDLAKSRNEVSRPYSRAALDAAEIIEWIEARLVIPEGPRGFQPMRLAPFQKDFLTLACGERVQEAGLSIARKNAKTSTIAAWALFHVCTSRRWSGICVSLSGELAKELRRQMQAMYDESGLAEHYPDVDFLSTPSPGRVRNNHLGSELRVLAADKATGHAVGSDLVIFDEAGLLEPNQRDMWNNCFRSISARGGRLVAISVQGHSDVFADLLARAERDSTGAVVAQVHRPDPAAASDDREAWKMANPGIEAGIKRMVYMEHAYERSKASAADERNFRAFDMNVPENPSAGDPFVSASDWRGCIVHPEDLPERDGDVYLGIDMGHSVSMSAACMVWESGRVECFGAFPSDPNLHHRGRADRVGDAYERMRDNGELILLPGRAADPAQFLAHVAERLAGERVRSMAADRYREAEMLDALNAAGLDWPPVWRGFGFKDGSEDCRDAQRAILSGKLHVTKNLLLNTSLAETVLIYDPSKNMKLDKRRSKARIDAASAFVLAAATWHRGQRAPEGEFFIYDMGTGTYE